MKRWVGVVMEVGKDQVAEGINPNPKTVLAMDSYYVAADSKQILNESGVKFCTSVKPDRFKNEVKMVHPPGNVDKTGEWKGIYNDVTKEIFGYHYDTQKGVGIKYNYSRGFLRSTLKLDIKAHADRIPAYDTYKTLFEPCDNYNRGLHDRSWPHHRGGKGVSYW